jgi:hypothetical protein
VLIAHGLYRTANLDRRALQPWSRLFDGFPFAVGICRFNSFVRKG